MGSSSSGLSKKKKKKKRNNIEQNDPQNILTDFHLGGDTEGNDEEFDYSKTDQNDLKLQ